MNGERLSRSLPNADAAVVEPAKLTAYLLNAEHPIGADKAAFLGRFGFRAEAWQVLRAALLAHARTGLVVDQRASQYGQHFALEGPLPMRDGRKPTVRTAWVLLWGVHHPSFVIAHPGRQSGGQR